MAAANTKKHTKKQEKHMDVCTFLKVFT